MDKEKTCDNCKYFERHYIKRTANFAATLCGHCKCYTTKHKQLIHDCDKQTCGKWELSVGKKDKRRQSIENILRQMSKDLNGIAAVLKSTDE